MGAGAAPLASATWLSLLRVAPLHAAPADGKSELAATDREDGHAVTPWPAGQKTPPLRALDMQGRTWTLDALSLIHI